MDKAERTGLFAWAVEAVAPGADGCMHTWGAALELLHLLLGELRFLTAAQAGARRVALGRIWNAMPCTLKR